MIGAGARMVRNALADHLRAGAPGTDAPAPTVSSAMLTREVHRVTLVLLFFRARQMQSMSSVAAMDVRKHAPLLSERLEKGTDLVYQRLGLFEGGEVPTGRHVAPALNVEGPFGDAAHGSDYFMRKGGYSRRNVDVT